MFVYFLRHGETDWNKEQRLQGNVDIPLNEKGITLAEETRDAIRKEKIQFDFCYSSPLDRALTTAKIMMEGTSVTPITDERIREISFGDFEGGKIADLRGETGPDSLSAFFLAPDTYIASHGAESLDHLDERLKEFWEQAILPLEGRYENVLVACHGAVCRAFLLLLTPMDRSKFWSDRQVNCSLNCVEVHDGESKVLYNNRIFYDLSLASFNPLLPGKEN